MKINILKTDTRRPDGIRVFATCSGYTYNIHALRDRRGWWLTVLRERGKSYKSFKRAEVPGERKRVSIFPSLGHLIEAARDGSSVSIDALAIVQSAAPQIRAHIGEA